MFILSELEAFHPDPSKPLVLGIGNFDGLHLGHQALIQYVLEKARQFKGVAGLLTFQEHPQQILHPEAKPALLLSKEYKLFLISEFGMDYCFWLPFTAAFSQMEAETFVSKILVEGLRVKEVCLGYNAHFGHDRKGNAAMMKTLALRHGFEFEEIAPVKAAGDFVSSSRIRRLITEGRLEEAFLCLGRPFSGMAKVVAGDGRGKELGFPTANLEVLNETMPPEGVYPVEVRKLRLEKLEMGKPGITEMVTREKSALLRGVLNYGRRPTFDKEGLQKPLAEVHLFDFNEDLYGKTLEVFFHPRLRSEMTFKGPSHLREQIEKDARAAKKYFQQVLKKTFTKVTD